MHSVAGLVADKEGKTMKETYVKPSIVIERFSLTQNIASGCGVIDSSLGMPGQADKNTCAWLVGGVVKIFVAQPTCTQLADAYEDVNGICYNAPNSSVVVFGAM